MYKHSVFFSQPQYAYIFLGLSLILCLCYGYFFSSKFSDSYQQGTTSPHKAFNLCLRDQVTTYFYLSLGREMESGKFFEMFDQCFVQSKISIIKNFVLCFYPASEYANDMLIFLRNFSLRMLIKIVLIKRKRSDLILTFLF